MTTMIWLDGDFVDPAEARVSVTDHGFTVGDGAFETLRTQRGAPFAITRHLRRLRRSLDGLGITCERSDDELGAAMTSAAGRIRGEARIRLTVTGGPGPLGSQAPDGPATVVIAAQPLVPTEPTTAVVRLPWVRNERSAIAGVKSTSYAENVVALAHAREEGATEGLFRNTAGHLCEGTGSNVFAVIAGRILTPPLSSGCLAGITRELVLEIADVEEVDLEDSVLDEADELFLTSSTRDVQGIHRIDDRELGAPGPVTAKTAAAFDSLARYNPNP